MGKGHIYRYKDGQSNIATTRKNRPKGRFFEYAINRYSTKIFKDKFPLHKACSKLTKGGWVGVGGHTSFKVKFLLSKNSFKEAPKQTLNSLLTSEVKGIIYYTIFCIAVLCIKEYKILNNSQFQFCLISPK